MEMRSFKLDKTDTESASALDGGQESHSTSECNMEQNQTMSPAYHDAVHRGRSSARLPAYTSGAWSGR